MLYSFCHIWMYYFRPPSHPVFFLTDKFIQQGMCVLTKQEELCVCVWNRNQQSFRLRWCSTDALFTDLCFGFCPPLLLSPFPASFLPSSAPPFTRLFSLYFAIHPLMLYTSLKTLSPLMYVYPNFPFTSFSSLPSFPDLNLVQPGFWVCRFDPLPQNSLPVPSIFAPPRIIMETTTSPLVQRWAVWSLPSSLLFLLLCSSSSCPLLCGLSL